MTSWLLKACYICAQFAVLIGGEGAVAAAFRLALFLLSSQLLKGLHAWLPTTDLTYSDDYTADALPNRVYTGLPLGLPISQTLNPIATSYQPRVRAELATHAPRPLQT